MPIRINLLAEAHELEEQRRRDPIKRAIYVACALMALILVWAASKQVIILTEKSRLNDLEQQNQKDARLYEQASASQQKLQDVLYKLDSLTRLATNRLLNGSVLDALQQVATEDIQLTRLRVDQSYTLVEAVKSKRDDTSDRMIPGKPATATERIVFVIDARDNSLRPGEEKLNNWRQALGDTPIFNGLLNKTNEFRLTNRSAPQTAPGAAKTFVAFTLEGRIPDRIR